MSTETRTTLLGVPGLLTRHKRSDGLYMHQTFHTDARPISGYGSKACMRVEIRFDDNCNNGHQTFAIIANQRASQTTQADDSLLSGCDHDEIRRVFPELAPLIGWHLMSTDGPLHYVANTLYRAGDKDCRGYTAGEPTRWAYGVRFDDVPITHSLKRPLFYWLEARHDKLARLEPVAIAHPGRDYPFDPKYTPAGYTDVWHECPWDSLVHANEFCDALSEHTAEFVRVPVAWSKGKPRDLDAARRAAHWPEATEEQLMAPPAELEAALLDRLPALLADFRATMESIGFEWLEIATTQER